MYFNVHGSVSPCWLTVGFIDKWSETRSIHDIWFGPEFSKIRINLLNKVFKNKCLVCKKDMDEGVVPLAEAYEQFPTNYYPSLMELELSNQCNLECIMCSGELSSGIRKNRDKLPPLLMAYGDKFVDELREFVPHLTELRLNGGEPFAQRIVLDICDMVAEVNPTLKITVATNGTIMNKRVRHILDNNNIHINLSIDSLDRDRYAEIRVNGNLDNVMTNFEIFNSYCKKFDRSLCVMVNPMSNNWKEMGGFVRWTHARRVGLHFNTIRYPKHLSLWNQSPEFLQEVYDHMTYERSLLNEYKPNLYKFDNLIHQVKNWYLDTQISVQDGPDSVV